MVVVVGWRGETEVVVVVVGGGEGSADWSLCWGGGLTHNPILSDEPDSVDYLGAIHGHKSLTIIMPLGVDGQ